jgi:hypothetical protein
VAAGRRTSRAARALGEAPASLCPHCGRQSKTVNGVCADCWGVKDPDRAFDFRPGPKTEPLFDWGGWADDWLPVGAAAVAAVAVLALLVKLLLALL